MRVIGLMSGTSLDGVDAAVVETDGEAIFGFGPSLTLPYPKAFRAALRKLLDDSHAGAPVASASVEQELTRLHVDAVRALGVAAELIGFHGQTILHAPERGVTWQIGDAAMLARETGLPVAYDFRGADVAAGGQGAPLVPVFHAALAAELARPVLVVNIGGVANVTLVPDGAIGDGGGLVACDTGPGGALLDDFMLARTGAAMDVDGATALSGVADEAIVRALLADPFFALPAPKSLDRLRFAGALGLVAGLSTADGAATLAAFTARAIAGVTLPAAPVRVLVAGGGRRNAAIMAALRAAFAVSVAAVEAVGWDGDALEAQCFGFLAARVARGLALSFPGTTGVARPMAGGRIVAP
jgi:anhydro-N-acetylmuramic acid kinase